MKVFNKLNASWRTVKGLGSVDHLEDIKCLVAFHEIRSLKYTPGSSSLLSGNTFEDFYNSTPISR